jgi:hypothetical protein
VGRMVGIPVGAVGAIVGIAVGAVGARVGAEDGCLVGEVVGRFVYITQGSNRVVLLLILLLFSLRKRLALRKSYSIPESFSPSLVCVWACSR